MAKAVYNTFTPATCPKWDDSFSILDKPVSPELKALCKGMEKPPQSPLEALQRMQKVAWRVDPDAGIPRAMLVFLRLEELALGGDSKAMSIYIDRAYGKMPELMNVQLGKYQDKTDEELLQTFIHQGNEEAVYRLLKVADLSTVAHWQYKKQKQSSASDSSVKVVKTSDNPQTQAHKGV